MHKCPAVFKGYSWSFMIYAIQKCVKLVSHSLFLHFYNNNTLTLIRESETNFQLEKTLISMQLPSPISALQSIFMRIGQILNSVLLKQGFQSSVTLGWKSESKWHGHALVELLSAVRKQECHFHHLSGGKESHFPYLQTGVKVLSLPPDRCESIFYTALDNARAVSYEK